MYTTRNIKIYNYLWLNGVYPLQSYYGNYVYIKTDKLIQLLEKYNIQKELGGVK